MEQLFITLLNRSIAAGWLILVVIVLRQILRKAPRWIHCALWALVAVRLVCPFSIESVLSLIPSAETFDAYNVQYEMPQAETGITGVDHAVNATPGSTFAPSADTSVNPLYTWMYIAGIVWAIGVAALLLYAAVSSALLRYRVREAALLRDSIWVGDAVQSPFILGVVRPRIYLPSGMEKQYVEPVIAHEQAHLARHDHWWKPLGFALLAVYWFNPLCWAAYLLLCRDIELACDERVIRGMELAARKDYSYALVACGSRSRHVLACPLAFGEVGVKERVKKVLNYKRPAFWLVIAAVAACVAAGVCFLTDPETDEAGASDTSVSEEQADVETGDAAAEVVGSETGESSETAAEDETDGVTVEADAISTAILEHNQYSYPQTYDVACVSFIPLATAVADRTHATTGESMEELTYYGWALYQEFDVTEAGLETVGSSHLPVILTFLVEEHPELWADNLTTADASGKCEYSLTEYWIPGDGADYEADIREKFPPHIVEDALDSQKYIYQQIRECYAQAIEASGLDADAAVGALLEKIMQSPAESSSTADYISAHSTEYRELLYYGAYTQQYYKALLATGDADSLEAQILKLACEEIGNGTVTAEAGIQSSYAKREFADVPAPDGDYTYDYTDGSGEQMRLSIAWYDEFTYQPENYYASTAESEGSPDWGIEILFSDSEDPREFLYFYQCESPSLNWSDYEENKQKSVQMEAGGYKLAVVKLEDKVIGYSTMGTSYQGIYFEVSPETWAEKVDLILAIVASAVSESAS